MVQGNSNTAKDSQTKNVANTQNGYRKPITAF